MAVNNGPLRLGCYRIMKSIHLDLTKLNSIALILDMVVDL